MDSRIGKKFYAFDGAKMKAKEKIFKIVKEKDVEVGSSDEEDTDAKVDHVHHHRHSDKDIYIQLYKKTRKIVKNTLESSTLKPIRLDSQK